MFSIFSCSLESRIVIEQLSCELRIANKNITLLEQQNQELNKQLEESTQYTYVMISTFLSLQRKKGPRNFGFREN